MPRVIYFDPSQKVLPKDKSYYTTKELAKMLGISNSTLKLYRRKGGGPEYIQHSPRTIRYAMDAVARYIQSRTRHSTSQ